MSVIHVTQQSSSTPCTWPQLRPLIGKKVEITNREVANPGDAQSGWDALAALAGQDLLDPEAFKELRNLDHDPWNDDPCH